MTVSLVNMAYCSSKFVKRVICKVFLLQKKKWEIRKETLGDVEYVYDGYGCNDGCFHMPKPIKLHILNMHSSLCIKYLNKAAKKKTLSFKCLYLNIASGSVIPNSLKPFVLYPVRLLCSWNSPGKNTGVGSHSLLQEMFPTQGWNPGLLHYRHILYHLSHQEKG